MHYCRTILLRLSFVVLVVLFIQLSLSISPVLSQDITIGTQTWTSKNLDVSTFRNGEAIPEAKNKAEWRKASDNNAPAWCYYEFDEKNGKKYGKLYNWHAVIDSRGLAPDGYRLPYDEDYDQLIRDFGGIDKAGEKLKDTIGWKSISNNGKKQCSECSDWSENKRKKTICPICKGSKYISVPEAKITGGDNGSNFSALPAGCCNLQGDFVEIEEHGYWWSTSGRDWLNAWCIGISFKSIEAYKYYDNKSFGCSVRCIKDEKS